MSAGTAAKSDEMKKLLFSALFSLCGLWIILSSTGCVAVAVGAGAAVGTAYVMGEYEMTVYADYRRIEKAIKGAAKEMNFSFVEGEGDAISGRYSFKAVGGDTIKVRYKTLTDESYRVAIRVGSMGDQAVSQRMDQAIQRRL